MENTPLKIALLASGSGSNAEKIAHYFNQKSKINCSLLISNKEAAGVFKRFEQFPQVKSIYLSNKEFKEGGRLLEVLIEQEIDYIILAGFLLKIPAEIVTHFPKKILNIHPALLPKYGGKGMYGQHVHEAVINNNEVESGITIHLVNEVYDEGTIVFQAKCKVVKDMNAQQLAAKVQQLEHQHYPKVIEEYILDSFGS